MIKSIKEMAIYRDGGTRLIHVTFDSGDNRNLYIDNRIGSFTKGEIFDKYPTPESTPSELSNLVKEYLKTNTL